MKFTLEIELGNAAMSTPEDIAQALRKIADQLEGGKEHGPVKDINGNTVGQWSLPGEMPGEE